MTVTAASVCSAYNFVNGFFEWDLGGSSITAASRQYRGDGVADGKEGSEVLFKLSETLGGGVEGFVLFAETKSHELRAF